MATRVTTDPALECEPPRQVFQTDFMDTPGRSFAVSPDGRRLLVVKRAEPDRSTAIQVVSELDGDPPSDAGALPSEISERVRAP